MSRGKKKAAKLACGLNPAVQHACYAATSTNREKGEGRENGSLWRMVRRETARNAVPFFFFGYGRFLPRTAKSATPFQRELTPEAPSASSGRASPQRSSCVKKHERGRCRYGEMPVTKRFGRGNGERSPAERGEVAHRLRQLAFLRSVSALAPRKRVGRVSSGLGAWVETFSLQLSWSFDLSALCAKINVTTTHASCCKSREIRNFV